MKKDELDGGAVRRRLKDFMEASPPGAFAELIARLDEQIDPALGWTGVARIHDGNVSGSGVLLRSGAHLLTAAHVVEDLDAGRAMVEFLKQGGSEVRAISSVTMYSDYLSNDDGVWHDLALVTLTQAAPSWAIRSPLYLGDVIGKDVALVGYGQLNDTLGNELAGHSNDRKAGGNTADTLGSAVAFAGFKGSLDSQIFFDFDDGTPAHDALGKLLGNHHLGCGATEAMITPGDSGGGMFLQQNGAAYLAGINVLVYTYPNADVSRGPNSSVGDIGVATQVASYAPWIAGQTGEVQAPVPQRNVPPSAGEVPINVNEGDGVWFLIQLGAAAKRNCGVHFTTRDGIAVAGEDYVPTSGLLSMVTGERWAKIWVQTLADNIWEGNETFSLVLFDPEGASFPAGQHELSASRTIVDDVRLTGETNFIPDIWG